MSLRVYVCGLNDCPTMLWGVCVNYGRSLAFGRRSWMLRAD